jgi:hypothetical protein
MFNKAKLQDLFLSYSNDFLSIERFAEYYNLTVEQAKSVIARGRVLFLSNQPEQRNFTYNQNVKNMGYSENNAKFFQKRAENALLSEASA